MGDLLVSVSGLSIKTNDESSPTTILNNASLNIRKGETIGLIGETGSGKSVFGCALVGLLPDGCHISRGKIIYEPNPGLDLTTIRGRRVAIIFQDPAHSLNPLQTIGKQIKTILCKRFDKNKESIDEITRKWLRRVKLDKTTSVMERYPHQLSGGQMQRVMIALSLSINPELVIADEITTGLDAKTKFETLKLLFSLQKKHDVAILFISHDMTAIQNHCHRVVMMRSGKISKRINNKNKQATHKELVGGTSVVLEDKNQKMVLSALKLNKTFINNGAEQKALRDVSINVYSGKTLGVIGESGSGKTTLVKTMLNLLDRDSGDIKIHEGNSIELLNKPNNKIGAVLQDNIGSINPKMKIRQVLYEPLDLIGIADKETRERKVSEKMKDVRLSKELLDRYPHTLSGGQRQRISLARALLSNPKVIIFDEPTSALDSGIQKKIIKLLKSLQKEKKLSYLFISHDLHVVSEVADTIAVLYNGEIVDFGAVSKILKNPEHEYTKKLIDSFHMGKKQRHK